MTALEGVRAALASVAREARVLWSATAAQAARGWSESVDALVRAGASVPALQGRVTPAVASATLAVLLATTALLVALWVVRRVWANMPVVVFNFNSMHTRLDEFRRKYGNMVVFYAGWRRFVFINEPEGVKHVMLSHRDNYPKAGDLRSLLYPALGTGLLVSDHALWAHNRKVMNPLGHDAFKQAHFGAIITAVRQFMRMCREQAGKEIDLYKCVDAVTTQVMEAIAFSTTMPDNVRVALHDMFNELERQCQRLVRLHPLKPSFRRTMSILNTWIYAQISARREVIRANPEYSNLDALTMLIKSNEMDDEAIRNEIITLMFAGHDAVALAITFTTYLVAQHPEVERRLREEANAVLASEITFEQSQRMTYADKVFREGMRYWSPVPLFARRPMAADEICGVKIKKSDTILMSSWCMHRREDLFPNALRFDPDRWDKAHPNEYQYFPFAVPPRSCLGRNFAFTEAKVFLPLVFRELHFDVVREPTPLNIEWHYGLTAQPEHGMWVRPSVARASH